MISNFKISCSKCKIQISVFVDRTNLFSIAICPNRISRDVRKGICAFQFIIEIFCIVLEKW